MLQSFDTDCKTILCTMFKAIRAKLENLGRELETIKSDIKNNVADL